LISQRHLVAIDLSDEIVDGRDAGETPGRTVHHLQERVIAHLAYGDVVDLASEIEIGASLLNRGPEGRVLAVFQINPRAVAVGEVAADDGRVALDRRVGFGVIENGPQPGLLRTAGGHLGIDIAVGLLFEGADSDDEGVVVLDGVGGASAWTCSKMP
jgi:hypothetical protein